MKLYYYLGCLIAFLSLSSCKKQEGKGGKLSIKGSVLVRYYSNNLSKFTQQLPGKDVEVYLVYGNSIGVGERIRTDYQGNFEFPYLSSGNYKVYVYSKDTTGTIASQDLTVVQDVKLSDNTQLPPFIIAQEDKRDPNEGKFSISGKLYATFYNRNFTVKTDSGYLVDEDVYIIKEGSDPLYFEKQATMPDGSFVFPELSAGTYKVYAVSDDTVHTTSSGRLVSEKKITITNANAEAGTLVVAKEDKRRGAYSISGTVNVRFCDNEFSSCRGPFASPDFDVFIMREGELSYFEKVSSGDKGYYEIRELPNGSYTVYVISKNDLSVFDPKQPPLVTIKKTVTINNGNISSVDFILID